MVELVEVDAARIIHQDAAFLPASRVQSALIRHEVTAQVWLG